MGVPHKPETWPVDADGHEAGLCTECGTPTHRGSRHVQCAPGWVGPAMGHDATAWDAYSRAWPEAMAGVPVLSFCGGGWQSRVIHYDPPPPLDWSDSTEGDKT